MGISITTYLLVGLYMTGKRILFRRTRSGFVSFCWFRFFRAYFVNLSLYIPYFGGSSWEKGRIIKVVYFFILRIDVPCLSMP